MAKSRDAQDMRLALTPLAKPSRAKNKGRRWVVSFRDGRVLNIPAPTHAKAQSAARLKNHSGIVSIVLQTNAAKDRRAAVAAFRKNPGHRDAYALHRSVTADLQRAENLLESFSGSRATKEYRVSQKPIKTGIAIGPLTGVMYAADRGDGVHEYCHRFKKSSRPLLITDSDGNQLGIVGGRFRFTDRGITDE